MDDYHQSVRAGASLDAKHDRDDPFAAAIRATRLAMVVTDARQPDQPIIFANDAFCALTGYPREEVIGRNCRFLQGPDTDPREVARIREAIDQGHDVASEILNYRKDGSSFWNALFLSPVRNDAGEITYFFGSQLDVTEKKAAQLALSRRHNDLEGAVVARTHELQAALDQKTTLLHEIDHRVKNNLQLISSLMLLQTRREPDAAVKRAMRGMLERVNAVATVHRRLFQNDDVQSFDVAEFVRDLVADVIGASGRDDIQARLQLERIDVPASRAAPLALVVNELLMNAVRHGLPPGRAGEVAITIRREGEVFRIEIADNGVGMNEATAAAGFGLQVVKLLCQQLRAKSETDLTGPGVRHVILLPVNGVH